MKNRDTLGENRLETGQQNSGSLLGLGQLMVISIAFQLVIGMLFGAGTLVAMALTTALALMLFTQVRAIEPPPEPIHAVVPSNNLSVVARERKDR